MLLFAISSDAARNITLAVIAVALLFILVILMRVNRDKSVRKSKWGFFVEREHYGEDEVYRTNFGAKKPMIPTTDETTKEIKLP